MPRRSEFRATTDQMLDILDDLRAVEVTKRQVEMGSPAFVVAAKRAEELSRLAFRWAQMQLQMALEVQTRVASGELPPNVRLENVEPRPLDRILAHWREAQIRLEIATPASPEAEAAARDIERLREEYHVTHELLMSRDGADLEGQPSPIGRARAGDLRGDGQER